MLLSDAEASAGEPETTETVESETTETAAAEPQEQVSVPIPPPRLSRRAQAAEDSKKREAETERKYQEQLSARDADLSRLRSELAMRPVHTVQVPAQQQYQQPADPDPDEILREANKALDNRDMDTYHRKLRESHVAAARRDMAPTFAQLRQQQQPAQQQMDPQLTAMLGEFHDVVNSPNGLRKVLIADAELDADGHTSGPARARAAFLAVRQKLAAARKPNGAQYDRSSAAVLGSSPTGRGSGAAAASSAPSISMSADEERTARAIAKKAGMTWDEYVSDLPEARAHRGLR